MKRPSIPSPIVAALLVNAGLLALILVVLLSHGGPGLGSVARAEPAASFQQPIASGGAGIFIVPAQFHSNVYGCYLIDVDRQTLCAYEYQSGDRSLTLTAARSFRFDLQLKNHNTFPSPVDIEGIVNEQEKSARQTESVRTTVPAEKAPAGQ